MPRRSAILTAAATLALAVVLLTAASWLAGAVPANASPARASVSAPHGVASSVAQQQPEPDEPTSDSSPADEPASHDIVVRPDREPRPQRAEDRGGALQITVLLVVVGGIGTIAALAVRESRRKRGRSATSA